jgi:hypothetical protein
MTAIGRKQTFGNIDFYTHLTTNSPCTGVWQHYCNEQALKSIQFTRQKESPGAMAAVLSGTQY